MPASPPKVPGLVIATPCFGGLMAHVYVHSILKLMTTAGGAFQAGLLTVAHDSLVPRTRNALLKTFLDTAGSHLFFVDADIGFEPESVHRMLAFDQDVVAGMYPVKALDWAAVGAAARRGVEDAALPSAGLHFVGVPATGAEHEEKDGFVTAKYAGTGFMMIKRAAIERLVAAYPETRYTTMQTFPPQPQGAVFHNLFDCIVDPETGTYLSEDFTFCHRFRKIGGKIWIDTRSNLRHVGSHEYSGPASLEIAKYG